MMTLFDQEKVWEIERYNIRKEGYEEGLREVIQKMRSGSFAKIVV